MRQIVRAGIVTFLIGVCAVAAPDRTAAQTADWHVEARLTEGRDLAKRHVCEGVKSVIIRLERDFTEDAVRDAFQRAGLPSTREERREIVAKAKSAVAELKGLLAGIDCTKPPPDETPDQRQFRLVFDALYRVQNAQDTNQCTEFVVALQSLATVVEQIPVEKDWKYDKDGMAPGNVSLQHYGKEWLDRFVTEGCPKKEIQQAKPQQRPQKKGARREAQPKGAPQITTPGLVINTGFDGSQWCTYGSGIGFPTFAPPTDDSGTPLVPGGTFINQPPTWPLPLPVSPPWGGTSPSPICLPARPSSIRRSARGS